MNLEDLLKELQALIDKYSADDSEPTDEDAARMAELTKSINEIRAKQTAAAETRAATVAAARAAIDNGTARRFRPAGVLRKRRWPWKRLRHHRLQGR